MSVFRIGGYNYSKKFGSPALIPSKLKEDLIEGRDYKRSRMSLTIMMNLKDGWLAEVGKFCKEDYIDARFPRLISRFFEVNNVPFRVEATKEVEEKGQRGVVDLRVFELQVKKI